MTFIAALHIKVLAFKGKQWSNKRQVESHLSIAVATKLIINKQKDKEEVLGIQMHYS